LLTSIKKSIRDLIFDKKLEGILAGSAWALSARVIATGIALVTHIIVARIYGAEVLGIVAALNSFLLIAAIFTVFGTNMSILRLIPEHLAKYSPASAFKVYRKTQFFVIIMAVVTGIIIFLCSDFMADKVFSKPHLEFFFSLAAIFIIFKSLMDLNTSAVRGIRLNWAFALLYLLPPLSQLVILVLITVLMFHPANPIYALYASIAITAVTGAIIMDRAFKKKINPYDTVHPMPAMEIIAISTPMLLNATMTFVIKESGIIMLAIFRPEAEVGYYAVAVRLASLTIFVLAAINIMAAPKISELFHSDKMHELFYVAKKSTKVAFWATVPILLFLFFLGKPLLFILFGPDFTVAYSAMVLLVIGQFVNSASGVTGTFMNMTGNQNILVCVKTLAVLLNVILNLIFTPYYGIYGAALAAMVSIIFWNITILIYIKRKYGESIGYLPFKKNS